MTSSDNPTDWQSIMKQYEGSGLTQPEFCKRNNIDFAKFRYQRVRL